MLESDLIFTLAAAFVAAFVGGFIASRVGLPPIVGYLMAGVVIGPYTPGGSAEISIAAQLADVGVILLMFGVGLHFSPNELVAVGPVAIPGALSHSLAATGFGLGLGLLWGWTLAEGVMLGLALSVASTVVLLRVLDDRGLLETHAGHVAVGCVIVEDLFTVLVLVLLPALAGAEDSGVGLASLLNVHTTAVVIGLSMFQATGFIAVMLFVGPRLIPGLLGEVVKAGSRELFTLCILAVALGVSFGAAEFLGISLALGAFLAGVVLNESELSHRAGLEALPLRDAFAVVFFVSVGMLFDPRILLEEPLQVLAIVTVIVAGKAVSGLLIVVLLGFGLRTGLVVAAGLAQIGEFSFILVALGITLGVLPAEATSLILAGAIISITLNPIVFRNLDRAEAWLARGQKLAKFAGRRQPEQAGTPSVRRHIIVCGYGQTGFNLAESLSGRNLPFVVIEEDPFLFERLSAAGWPCVFGDASQPGVLEQAGVADARIVAVTFTNHPTGTSAVRNAHRLNPEANVVAQGTGRDSHRQLRLMGASVVIDPEFESSLEFVRHVLQRYSVDSREIVALQARWRAEHYAG